jgi:hypothetical protein
MGRFQVKRFLLWRFVRAMPQGRLLPYTFCRTRPERQRPAGIEAKEPCFERKNTGVKNETGAGFYFKTLSRRDGGAPGKAPDK